jgi:3-methyl-2-oxobutanoate hydroxymethyltransferase
MSITIRDLRAFKERRERFIMLTAYDYPTASILDEAGVPVILVGDSLAQTVLGYETTLPITMEEMLHHTRAVARGAKNALIVGDMPFLSYQTSLEEGIRNAGRFLKEAGAHAVKLEGPMIELVQGKNEEDAHRLLDQAHALAKAGIFSLVLEGIPSALAAQITESLRVPTIGIGAGPACDAQVLVLTDLLGLGTGNYPKFAKRYADLRGVITVAVSTFQAEVASGQFPDEEHSYH